MPEYTPEEVGHVFVVCGLAMAVFQFAGVAHLATRVAPAQQVAAGFVLMGASLGGLLYVHSHPLVLLVVALCAALGLKDAANSLGQAAGPILGTLLFVWDMTPAYSLTGALLVAVGIFVKARPKHWAQGSS